MFWVPFMGHHRLLDGLRDAARIWSEDDRSRQHFGGDSKQRDWNELPSLRPVVDMGEMLVPMSCPLTFYSQSRSA